jgi:hypothetical protein
MREIKQGLFTRGASSGLTMQGFDVFIPIQSFIGAEVGSCSIDTKSCQFPSNDN